MGLISKRLPDSTPLGEKPAGKKLIFLLIVEVLLLRWEVVQAQWVQAGLAEKSVYALAAEESKIYAGAFANGAFVSVDNGSNWTTINSGLPAQLATFGCFISCFMVMDTILFAGTAGRSGNGVYVSSNGGEGWSAVNQGLTHLKITAMVSDGRNLYAGTNGGGVFWSGNKGENWKAMNAGLTNLKIATLQMNGSEIFAGTNGGGVFISDNQKSSWIAANDGLTNLNIQSLLMFDTDMYVGTHGGGVFMSADHGKNWKSVNADLPLNATIYALSRRGNTIMAGIKNHGVYTSVDQGKSWVSWNDGLPSLVFTAMASSNTYLFVGLDGIGIWKRKLTDLKRMGKD